MRRRRFSREFKVEAVKLVRERGVSVAQAARDLDVHEFHRHTGHATRFEPICQIAQVLRKCAKRAHWLVSAGRVDRSQVHF